MSDAENFNMGQQWNMSLMTLKRINDLLVDCQKYSVNGDLIGYRNNLKEVYKEFKPWLDTPEKKTAASKWNKVIAYKITMDDEKENYIYDSQIWNELDEFDFWIRNKLHKKNVTFDKKNASPHGMSNFKKRYGL